MDGRFPEDLLLCGASEPPTRHSAQRIAPHRPLSDCLIPIMVA
jgi:hypothetical protein